MSKVRGFRFKNGLLAEDPRGYDVVFPSATDTNLLGRVVNVSTRNGIEWLDVHYFNGEPWPDQVMANEVYVLVRETEACNAAEE